MDRAELIKSLQAEYAQKQGRNRADAEARLREAEQRDPMIAQLRSRSSVIALNALRQMTGGLTPERSREIADNMRREGLENNRRIRERLAMAGFPEDYLEEKYSCPICRDTGYTDEIPARFCECFERELRLRMFEDGTMAGLEEQNFDSFSEALIRRANTPEDAERIMYARYFCSNYAEQYPENKKPNILLYGKGGVGKTFLLNCIFARIIERGFSGIRITAYRMHEAMRKKHVGTFEDAHDYDELLETPVLMIDDLGTEPVMRNITVEYLFTLLNERCAAKKHTLIATNLTPEDIKERYGERVASRIMDTGRCTLINMKGADLRRAR